MAAEAGARDDPTVAENRLFLGGDVKQAIYGERALCCPGHSELAFRATAAGVVQSGRIDRLWQDGEDWVVLD